MRGCIVWSELCNVMGWATLPPLKLCNLGGEGGVGGFGGQGGVIDRVGVLWGVLPSMP